MKKVLSVLLVLVILLGGGGYLLATAADASTPAEPFMHKVDVVAESLQRAFTFGELAQAEFEQDVLDERAAELEELLAEEAEEEVLGVAVDDLDKQRERTEERVQEFLNAEGNYEEAELERVRNRYETQLANQVKNMEKVQEEYQNMGEETKKNFENSQREMETATDNGNSEQNVNDDAGDGVNNQESNSNDTPGESPNNEDAGDNGQASGR